MPLSVEWAEIKIAGATPCSTPGLERCPTGTNRTHISRSGSHFRGR